MATNRLPLHQRINWPDWVDMQNIAVMIASGFMTWRADVAGLSVEKVRKYHKERFTKMSTLSGFIKGEYEEKSIAAMWYAVMRTAIETYGLKS